MHESARCGEEVGGCDRASGKLTWIHQNAGLSALRGMGRRCAGRGDRIVVRNRLWTSDTTRTTSAENRLPNARHPRPADDACSGAVCSLTTRCRTHRPQCLGPLLMHHLQRARAPRARDDIRGVLSAALLDCDRRASMASPASHVALKSDLHSLPTSPHATMPTPPPLLAPMILLPPSHWATTFLLTTANTS